MVCDQITQEMQNAALAQHELLVSYLRIFPDYRIPPES